MMKRTMTKMGKTVTFRIACALDDRAERTGSKALSCLAGAFFKMSMIDWPAVGLLGLVCALYTGIGILVGAMYVKPHTGLVGAARADYATTLQVVDVQDMDGEYVVTLRTASGIMYTYISQDGDICPLELYTAAMSDTGTPDDIRDDRVVTLRYTGF